MNVAPLERVRQRTVEQVVDVHHGFRCTVDACETQLTGTSLTEHSMRIWINLLATIVVGRSFIPGAVDGQTASVFHAESTDLAADLGREPFPREPRGFRPPLGGHVVDNSQTCGARRSEGGGCHPDGDIPRRN